MSGLKPSLLSGVLVSSFLLIAVPLHGGQLSPSTEVQQNIRLLQETKSCPRCNLHGAELSRMDLSGADLQGADLSRARLFLTDLSGANLRDSVLREAVFGGADLANADLRGADLAGASLSGAYLVGTFLDGDMVTTTPYAQDAITDVEETVYVDDTVKPKTLPETEQLTIASRRDFEETPPAVPEEAEAVPQSPELNIGETAAGAQNVTDDEQGEAVIPEQSVAAPDSKAVPAIQTVRLESDAEEAPVLLADTAKRSPGAAGTLSTPAMEERVVSQTVEENVVGETEVIEKAVQNGEAAEPDTSMDQGAPVALATEKEAALPAVQGTAAADAAVLEEPLLSADGESPPLASEGTAEGTTPEPGAGEAVAVVAGVAEEQEGDAAGLVSEEAGAVLAPVSPAVPSAEILENIEILLDTNRCYGCNLAGADLSGENLDEADLEGADLSNALLRKADLEEANLKGANLSGADLSGADLSGADLYRAVLRDADLSGAELEGCLLDDADLSGVKGYQQGMLLMESN